MGNKIDKLYTSSRIKVDEIIRDHNKYTLEISRLQEKSKNLSQVIEKALDDGDLPTFKQATEDKAQADFDIKAMQRFVNEIGKLKPENFSDVWNSFITEYETEFNKAFREYKSARKALYNQYMALYEMQKKAVCLRHSIALACGMHVSSYIDSDLTELAEVGVFSGLEKFPVRISSMKLSPDAAFFASIGEIPAELDEEFYRVVKCNNP